jgi:hypothetical protein
MPMPRRTAKSTGCSPVMFVSPKFEWVSPKRHDFATKSLGRPMRTTRKGCRPNPRGWGGRRWRNILVKSGGVHETRKKHTRPVVARLISTAWPSWQRRGLLDNGVHATSLKWGLSNALKTSCRPQKGRIFRQKLEAETKTHNHAHIHVLEPHGTGIPTRRQHKPAPITSKEVKQTNKG